MKQTRILSKESGQSIRIESDSEGKKYFVGYAAVYNSPSRVIFERGRVFNEILEPGCFDRVLADPAKDVVLTLDHNHFYNLGRTKSGNLTIHSDDIGLFFRASVPDTSLGRDTWEMIQRGDYTDCSFQFSVDDPGEVWEMGKDGDLVHKVREVSGLYDLAICTLRGAYEQTIIDVEKANRMFNDINKEKEKEEKAARKKEAEEQLEREIAYRKAVIQSHKG